MYDKEIDLRFDKTLGYYYFLDNEHPLATSYGKVYHHRHVASLKEGRWLERWECVHHVDEIKTNNDPDNLEVMTYAEHSKLHHPGEKEDIISCDKCGREFKPDKITSKYCSVECYNVDIRKVERPSAHELKELIENNSWCALGRMFGVSDNAVRKWAKSYGLL